MIIGRREEDFRTPGGNLETISGIANEIRVRIHSAQYNPASVFMALFLLASILRKQTPLSAREITALMRYQSWLNHGFVNSFLRMYSVPHLLLTFH
jgi:hypothetical protein